MALVSYDNSDSESEINLKPKVDKESEIKRHVKIAIPRLVNSNKEEDEPSKKIIKPNHQMPSGLLSILPSPIHIPKNKFYKFDATVEKEKNLVPQTVITEKQNKIDNEEEICNKNDICFDSISKRSKIHLSESFIKVNRTPIKKDISTNAYFFNLFSKVNKRSVPKQEYELNACAKVVDLNSPEFKKDWKNAIREQTSSSQKKDEEKEPSLVSKKKHQITYLAYQAKKNEEQMKEQWAQNRMTRKVTQGKYGF